MPRLPLLVLPSSLPPLPLLLPLPLLPLLLLLPSLLLLLLLLVVLLLLLLLLLLLPLLPLLPPPPLLPPLPPPPPLLPPLSPLPPLLPPLLLLLLLLQPLLLPPIRCCRCRYVVLSPEPLALSNAVSVPCLCRPRLPLMDRNPGESHSSPAPSPADVTPAALPQATATPPWSPSTRARPSTATCAPRSRARA